MQAVPPFRITMVAAQPVHLGSASEADRDHFTFSTSLTRLGNELLIGFSEDDVTVSFKVVDEATLLDSMQAVTELA